MRNKNSNTGKPNKSALSNSDQGSFFQIRVTGHLDESWSDWLEGLEVKLLDNGETLLSGHITDQAALMGTLNKLCRLNLTLLSVKKTNQNK